MIEPETRRAALYLRQSKADDEGIERQRERTTALATARGWEVAGIFVDDDVSASKFRGAATAWGRMIATASTIDVVIAVDLDRIARSTRDLNTLIDHGLALVTVDGEIDLASADGEFRGTMLAAIARFETRRKGERQRRANDQRAAKGLPSARPGYGYLRRDGRDVVVEAEAEIIQAAARRVLGGHSLRSTVAELNRQAVPSPRSAERSRQSARTLENATATEVPWSVATLRQMLRRPSLAGLRTHRGHVVGEFDPAAHPAILDRDTHDRLVAQFGDPTRTSSPRVGRPAVHLLSGIAWCGLCGDTRGGRMKRIPGWQPKPGQSSKPTKPAYACGTCHRVRRLQQPVDELVTEYVLQRLEAPDAAELLASGDPEVVLETRAAIAAVTARLSNAADLFAAGSIDGDQLARITAAGRVERDALKSRLAAALPSALPRNAVGAEARRVWQECDTERRRLILRAICRVTILPAGPGRGFNPDLVRVDWRQGE
ncbi:MAG: recombinase family protein [Actinomycetota bacterium]